MPGLLEAQKYHTNFYVVPPTTEKPLKTLEKSDGVIPCMDVRPYYDTDDEISIKGNVLHPPSKTVSKQRERGGVIVAPLFFVDEEEILKGPNFTSPQISACVCQ